MQYTSNIDSDTLLRIWKEREYKLQQEALNPKQNKTRSSGLKYQKKGQEWEDYDYLYKIWKTSEFKSAHKFKKNVLVGLGYDAIKQYVGLINRFKKDLEAETKLSRNTK